MATIYDVARAAGVATSTVSRSFSTPTRVNARTRERVLAVALELGYRPAHDVTRHSSRPENPDEPTPDDWPRNS